MVAHLEFERAVLCGDHFDLRRHCLPLVGGGCLGFGVGRSDVRRSGRVGRFGGFAALAAGSEGAKDEAKEQNEGQDPVFHCCLSRFVYPSFRRRQKGRSQVLFYTKRAQKQVGFSVFVYLHNAGAISLSKPHKSDSLFEARKLFFFHKNTTIFCASCHGRFCGRKRTPSFLFSRRKRLTPRRRGAIMKSARKRTDARGRETSLPRPFFFYNKK